MVRVSRSWQPRSPGLRRLRGRLLHVCHRYAGRPCHSCGAGCQRVGRLAQKPAHGVGTNPGRERQSSAQRARAPRWGSSFAAASRAAGRTCPSAASRATTSPSRSQPASTNAGPERSTSSTATSDGDRPASSLPTGRCVNRTCVHGAGALSGTAVKYVDGICEVRPSQFAAATPAGPEPEPPIAKATSSARGSETPSGVGAPFQYPVPLSEGLNPSQRTPRVHWSALWLSGRRWGPAADPGVHGDPGGYAGVDGAG